MPKQADQRGADCAQSAGLLSGYRVPMTVRSRQIRLQPRAVGRPACSNQSPALEAAISSLCGDRPVHRRRAARPGPLRRPQRNRAGSPTRFEGPALQKSRPAGTPALPLRKHYRPVFGQIKPATRVRHFLLRGITSCAPIGPSSARHIILKLAHRRKSVPILAVAARWPWHKGRRVNKPRHAPPNPSRAVAVPSSTHNLTGS